MQGYRNKFSDPGHYKEFKKEAVLVLYMPVWTWFVKDVYHQGSNFTFYREEINYCRKACYPSVSLADCLKAYDLAGGVPRLTLLPFARDRTVEDVKAKLLAGITEMKLEQVWRLAGAINLEDTKQHEVVHRLLHLYPTADYTGYVLQFASPWIFEMLCKAGSKELLDEARIFLQHNEGACYAALRGQIFEAYAHRTLAAGGTFRVRALKSATESQETIIPRPPEGDGRHRRPAAG